jgi:hypothetical protein
MHQATKFGYAGDSWRLVEPLLLSQIPAQTDRRRALCGFLGGAAAVLAAQSPALAAHHGQPTAPTAQAAVPGNGVVADDRSALTAAGRSPLPALMRQYALLAVADAAATGAGSAAGGSHALQAAGGRQAAEPDAGDPGLQPVLQLLHLDAALLPPLLAALGNLPTSHPADSVTAAAPGQSSALPTLPAAAEAAAGRAGGGRDEAALQEATGALSILAAVLADPLMRPATLEAERPVQRLIDATVQVCNSTCARLHAVCLAPSGLHWARKRVHTDHTAFMLGQLYMHAPEVMHSRCIHCRRRRRWASAHWLGINTSSC